MIGGNVDRQWKKLTSERTGDIISKNELQPDSVIMFDPESRPEAFIYDLVSADQWVDAIKTVSRSLPPREAVWWACMCVRQMRSLESDEAEMAALKAAETWVYQPKDENRLKAFELAQKSQTNSAGALAALTAVFNTGSLPLVDGTEAELDANVFSDMATATVMMSAGDTEPQHIYELYRKFIASADDIANGGNGRIEEREAQES